MTRLVRLVSGGQVKPGAMVDNEVLDLRAYAACTAMEMYIPDSLIEILSDNSTMKPAIDGMVKNVLDSSDANRQMLREKNTLLCYEDTQLAAPLSKPGLIICSGNTYSAHVREMQGKKRNHVAGFIKNSHSVIGPGESIVLPQRHPGHVDYEGELAVVIGRACHDVAEEEAWNCIAGYLNINDVSARDWVEEGRASGDMFFNELGKQFPTFCPMGPWLLSADEVNNPCDMKLTTTVNGQQVQNASISELSVSIAEIISFWSRWYQFAPGDVISTGSPAGVGAARKPPVYLQPGDSITIETSGCGKLTNPVMAATQSAI